MTATKTVFPSYRWVILIINFAICAMAYAGLTLWSMVSGELAVTFNITSVQASLGSAIFMAGYAIGNYVEYNLVSKIV